MQNQRYAILAAALMLDFSCRVPQFLWRSGQPYFINEANRNNAEHAAAIGAFRYFEADKSISALFCLIIGDDFQHTGLIYQLHLLCQSKHFDDILS